MVNQRLVLSTFDTNIEDRPCKKEPKVWNNTKSVYNWFSSAFVSWKAVILRVTHEFAPQGARGRASGFSAESDVTRLAQVISISSEREFLSTNCWDASRLN